MRKADDLPSSWCRTSGKSRALTYPEPLGPPRPVAGYLYLKCMEKFGYLFRERERERERERHTDIQTDREGDSRGER